MHAASAIAAGALMMLKKPPAHLGLECASPESGRAEVLVRPAEPEDASAIASIYAPHVLCSTVSFETVEPDVDEILRRRAAILELGLPFLVAELGGEVVGYAYANRFRPREAYRFTAENSVYVADRVQRRGVAGKLMQRLIELCAQARIREIVAVIADPSLSTASITLHRSMGFEEVGVLRGVGQKFGKTIDVLIMQKSLR